MNSFDYRERANAKLISWIAATGTQRSISEGSYLIREGDQAEALLFLMDGQLDAITRNDNQREVTLSNLAAGAVLGERAGRTMPARLTSAGRKLITNCRSPASKIGMTTQLAAQLHRLLAQNRTNSASESTSDEPLNPVEPLRKVLILFAN